MVPLILDMNGGKSSFVYIFPLPGKYLINKKYRYDIIEEMLISFKLFFVYNLFSDVALVGINFVSVTRELMAKLSFRVSSDSDLAKESVRPIFASFAFQYYCYRIKRSNI